MIVIYFFYSYNCYAINIITYFFTAFSLSTWLDDNNIKDTSSLEDVAVSRIMKNLGANQYLLADECSVQDTNAIDGWINGLYRMILKCLYTLIYCCHW